MIRLGKQEEIDAYFERSGASQSFLKALCKSVAYTKRDEKTMYYEEKGHLIVGSAVDDKISMGDDAFAEKYFSSEKEKPSEAMMSIVQMAFDASCFNDEAPDSTIHSYGIYVLEALDYHKYQTRWKEETRINKVYELGFEYFEELKEAHGKQILSVEQNKVVGNIEMSWRTHPYTSRYFVSATQYIFFQVPVYFEFYGVNCKALLDMVIYDGGSNTLQPIDFKTMSENSIMFPKSVTRFGYNFQGAFYREALRQAILSPDTTETIPELSAIINKETAILPFKFMVETTEVKTNKLTDDSQFMQGSPLMYTLSDEQIDIGKYGRPELVVPTHYRAKDSEDATRPLPPIRFKEILGFKQAIELYIWHSNNGWEIDKKVVEAEGDILI